MKFETWSTPFESGTIWLVDLSWGTKTWSLEKPDGSKYEISGAETHLDCDLVARIFHEDTETLYKVYYGVVNGFRCLDEHGLTEIWNSNRPQMNTLLVKNHGWHNESPLTFFMGNQDEWSHMLVTNDECLEVVCQDSPKILKVGHVSLKKNAT
ncbi:hypothetical protein J8L84_20020 [Alteromonas sp. MMG017]|uniref:hypothetical protein n=1 Tax=Alteromonas sp. MMG017 TaxID=2822692 RepID=UPI001B39CEB5|nr:hypothetical protein [Alteromonas sp. MMG017]MBQ4831568.1 hypothetical protein [Alteromonas sp. MMG017]